MSTERPGNGGGNSLKHSVRLARETAPDGADVETVAAVAWRVFDCERDPEDVWREVQNAE